MAAWTSRLLFALVLLGSCASPKPRLASRTLTLAPASRTERLAKLRSSLLPNARADLLVRVTDAQWAVEQIGDGVLGPSDFVYRIRLQVPRGDMPAWLAGPIEKAQAWAEPPAPLAWWIPAAGFQRARFADGSGVTGRPATLAALPDEDVVFVFWATQ